MVKKNKTLKRTIILVVVCLMIIPIKIYSQTDEEIKFEIDSIGKLADDTNKVIAYNKLIWQISYFDSINSVFCAEKSIELATKLEYWKGVGTAKKNLAAYYYYRADYQQALELYNSSLEYFQKANYKKGQSLVYRNLGNIHSQIGGWEPSFNFFLKSLQLTEELQDTLGKAKTLKSIGILFSSIENYEDSALAYFNRALEVFKMVDDKANISSTYLGIGSLYYNLATGSYDKKKKQDSVLGDQQLDSAIFYSKLCINVSAKIGEKRIEAMGYNAIGEVYLTKKEYDRAYFYLNKSLVLREEIENVFGILNSLKSLGDYYYKVKDYDNSLVYLKRALALSEEMETDQVTNAIMFSLSNTYKDKKNYKLAYEYYEKYSDLKDSLYDDSKAKEMTQLSMQYEFDKKQKLQELEQQKKDAIQAAKIKRQKLLSRVFIAGILMLLVVLFLIFRSYKQKAKNNKMLKDKNDEITLKNAQLNQSNEEIAAQRDEIDTQKVFLEKQNKEITSSINYARRIQRALLTPYEVLEENLADFFVLYKPRDIVSGDYFWASKLGDKFCVTAADCTGHGVPGAFMSMLGISFLNQIVNQEYSSKPQDITAADVLNKMREMIISSLVNDVQDNSKMQEGMDMAFVIIDKKEKTINFSGAYNPLLLIRNEELTVSKADRMPVGYHYFKNESEFTNTYIDYQEGDRIYMFSDGFQDQFGGEAGKKFSAKKLREMFLKNHKLPMSEQREIYNEIFENWINRDGEEFKQLDDVLVMGLKL